MAFTASIPRCVDPLTAGQRVGPFLLLAPLGVGGSGRVWAVTRTGQLGFTKRMALKVMREDKLQNERARQRFDREARLGAELRHPNLRAVHELGSHEGRPHMALAWVDTSLEELLEHAPGHRLDPELMCWFGIQACSALAAAHSHVDQRGEARSIVHGDVSPGNLLLTMSGHVLLSDLAASADPSSPEVEDRAPSHEFFGKLGYAAPEAVRGALLDGRADLYSLGCVLYEGLCGSPAFAADDERSLLFQVLEQGPPDLATRAPRVPAELVRTVNRVVSRRATERFSSAEELRDALTACVAGFSHFELERRSAEVIEDVLGARLRAREEAMRQVYRRQFERTDTLPIRAAARQDEETTLRAAAHAEPDVARIPDTSARVSAISRSRWLGLWTLSTLAVVLVAAYELGVNLHGSRLAPAEPKPSAIPTGLAPKTAEVVGELRALRAPTAIADPLPPAPAPLALPVRATPLASSHPSKPASPHRPLHKAAAPHATPAKTEVNASDGLEFHLPDDPYGDAKSQPQHSPVAGHPEH